MVWFLFVNILFKSLSLLQYALVREVWFGFYEMNELISKQTHCNMNIQSSVIEWQLDNRRLLKNRISKDTSNSFLRTYAPRAFDERKCVYIFFTFISLVSLLSRVGSLRKFNCNVSLHNRAAQRRQLSHCENQNPFLSDSLSCIIVSLNPAPDAVAKAKTEIQNIRHSRTHYLL